MLRTVFAIIILLAGMMSPLQASGELSLTAEEKAWLAEHKTIRLGVDPAYPPFEFIDANGDYRGMAADYVDLINDRLGIEMKVVPGLTWSETVERLKKGEIDVSSALTDTPERRRYLNFTQPYISFPTAIVTRTDREPAINLESFSGKKLALVKGYYYVDQIVRDYPEIEPLFVETPLEAIKAVSFGKADGLIENLATVSHLIAERNIPNLRLDAEADIQSNGLAIGVRQDWPMLVGILDKVLGDITRKEHLAIRNKWITIATKESSAVPKVELTRQEKAWLKNHPRIVLGGGVFPPLDGVDAQGNVEGIGPDYTTLLGEMLGVEFEYVTGDWTKMQERARNKEIDGLRLSAKVKKREEYLTFTKSYLTYSSAIFTKSDVTAFKSLASLKGKTVSTLKSGPTANWLKNNHPDINVLPLRDYDEIIDAVLNDKADAMIGAVVSVYNVAQKNMIASIKMVATIPELDRGLHVGIRKDWPELAAMLDKAISQIPSKTHMAIKLRWVPLIANSEKAEINLTASEKKWLNEHQIIRLGIDQAYPPFEFVDDKGNYQGMSSDYIALISRRLDVSMEISPNLSWPQVLEGVKSKQLDLLPAAANTEERQAYLNFTTPYIALPVAIMTRKNYPAVSGLKDFAGKTLSMVKGYYYVEEIARNYPNITVLLVDAVEEALKAVSLGKADGVVVNLSVGTYLAQKYSLLNLRVAADAGLKISNLSMGVRKDWPELVAILNKALDSITQEERLKIRTKWISIDNNMTKQVKVKLSEEERDWLNAHSPLRLGTDPDWLPIDFVGKDGTYQGIAADTLRLIAERLDMQIELVGDKSWSDSLNKMKAGEIDILSSISQTPGRMVDMNFTQPFLKFPIMIFTEDTAPFIGGIKELDHRRVAVVKEYLSHINLRDNHPGIDLVVVDSTVKGLEAVSTGQAFAFVGNLATASQTMTSEGISNLKVAAPTPYAYIQSIAVRKDWPELIPILNKGLASISEQEETNIYTKWISLQQEVGIDYVLIWQIVGGMTIAILVVGFWAGYIRRQKLAVERSQARLQSIIDNAVDGIIVIDEQGTIQTFSPAAETIFGYGPGEVIDENIKILMPEPYHGNHDGYLARFLQTGKGAIIGKVTEIVGVRKDGEEFPIELAIGEARFGKRRLFTGIVRNITARKAAEKALSEAKEKAEEATKAKATFLATMSHEIRTPMGGVIGMIDLLRQSKMTDDQRQMVNTVGDSAHSLLTIINDILDFSKIEAGKLDLEEIPISIRDVVEGAGEALAINARNKNIRLSVYIDPDIPDALVGDQVRLRQILFNFGSNAIKFTEKGNILIRADRVRARNQGKATVRFQVIDDGIGIPEEAQAKLFQAFTQVEASTTRRFGGTGLGLSICQRLTEMMDGEIGVESVLGEGSTFSATIDLPVAEEHTFKSDGHDLEGLNILLIHKDGDMRELIPRYLEHWNAKVTTAAEIDKTKPMALDATQDGTPFDIICLGSAWPFERQIDVVRSIQAEKKLSSTRYVVACGSRVKADRPEIDNTVYVDSGPLKRANFIKSIAVAAGRASPEVEFDESEITLDAGKAPTVAEAEAMGQLILLAEDNVTNQDVIRRQLTMLGYAIEIANDGKEALELLHSKSFAILLTDCHMPNMDGFELTQIIRKSEKDKDARFPIVAITASVMKEEVEQCFAAGMDDCLSKPLEMKKLRETLRKWMPTSEDDAVEEKKEPAPEDVTNEPEAGDDGDGDGDGGNGAIDPTALKSVFGDDEATFKEILKDFVEPATSNVSEIKGHFADRSADGVAKAAHKLKSSARSVGANELADLCLTLETAGKAKDWDEIDKAAPRLAGTIQSVVEYIDRL